MIQIFLTLQRLSNDKLPSIEKDRMSMTYECPQRALYPNYFFSEIRC